MQAAIYAIMQEKIAQSAGLNVTFGAKAEKAIAILNDRFMFIMNDARARTQNELKDIYTQALSGNFTRDELISEIREKFEAVSSLETYRLRAAADFTIRQNSNMGVVRMGLESLNNGITHAQVVAVVDEKTTPICLSMNRRVISLKELEPQYNAMLEADTIDKVKSSSNLNIENKGFYGKTLPKNFGIPPYHFGCRTTLRLLSDVQYEAKKQWLDEFGREYGFNGGVGSPKWEYIRTTKDHLVGSGYKTNEELFQATMSSISRIGIHKNKPKFIIQGTNGFLVFMKYNGEIETCFKPSDTKPSVYYDRYALSTHYDAILSRKVLKWLERLL